MSWNPHLHPLVPVQDRIQAPRLAQGLQRVIAGFGHPTYDGNDRDARPRLQGLHDHRYRPSHLDPYQVGPHPQVAPVPPLQLHGKADLRLQLAPAAPRAREPFGRLTHPL